MDSLGNLYDKINSIQWDYRLGNLGYLQYFVALCKAIKEEEEKDKQIREANLVS